MGGSFYNYRSAPGIGTGVIGTLICVVYGRVVESPGCFGICGPDNCMLYVRAVKEGPVMEMWRRQIP